MLPRRLSFARWFLCMSTAFPSASRMSCCMMAKAARSVVGHHECGRDETIRHRIGFTPVGPRRFPSGSFGRCEIPALALRGRRPGVRVRVRASVGARGCSVRARGWREERAEGSKRGDDYTSRCAGGPRGAQQAYSYQGCGICGDIRVLRHLGHSVGLLQRAEARRLEGEVRTRVKRVNR